MTATPTRSRPTSRRAPRSRASPSTATGTSRSSRTHELVGIVSMRDLMRIAKIQPAERLAHEMPKGLEGVVVAETTVGDVRGLEGFYHYRQYNAVDLAESAPARRRLAPDVRGRAADTVAERAAFAAEIAPLAGRSPTRSPTCCPRSRARASVRAARHAAHHDLAARRRARVPAVARHRRTRRCATTRCDVCAVVPDAAHRDLPAAARPRTDRARPTISATRRTTST